MKQYKNILVNALINLGDVVVSTSAIAILKKVYPDAKITMLVKPVVVEALENNPLIDEVIPFQYTAKENSVKAMWEMIKLLKSKNYDLSISFDRKLRPALLSWLAGIPVRVGPNRVFEDKPSKVTWFYTDVVDIKYDLENTLQAEVYQAIIRGFTGVDIHEQPVFARITDEAKRNAQKLLQQLPQAEKRIALCVKGTFALKTWPKEYFVQVVDALAEKYDASFYIVGAPNDREYAEEVIQAMNYPVYNFCGKTSLVDLAAIISEADLFITVDTGATHIAATTKVPMVVVYGCTTPRRWHPINENAVAMTTNEKCCPCHLKPENCITGKKPKCLWTLHPAQIIKECEKKLEC